MTIFLLVFLSSCTIISPNTGVGVAVQPVVPVTTAYVYQPYNLSYRNYWWGYNRYYQNNLLRPTVRININPPVRHFNGPRGGRRR